MKEKGKFPFFRKKEEKGNFSFFKNREKVKEKGLLPFSGKRRKKALKKGISFPFFKASLFRGESAKVRKDEIMKEERKCEKCVHCSGQKCEVLVWDNSQLYQIDPVKVCALWEGTDDEK